MKHVNDPVPSVLGTRPDAPIRLASLIERCLAKQPADRPASMDEVVAELEAVQAELDAREDGEGTMIMRRPAVVPARPPRQKRRGRRGEAPRPRLAADPRRAAAARGPVGGILLADRATTGRPARTAGGPRCRLQGVASYDPDGDDEGAQRARRRRDRRQSGHLLDDVELLRRLLEARRRPRARRRPARRTALTLTTRHARLHRRDPLRQLARGPVRHGRRRRARTAARRRRGSSTRRTRATSSSGSRDLDRVAHVNEVKAS